MRLTRIAAAGAAALLLWGCGAKGRAADTSGAGETAPAAPAIAFNADSAYSYVERQVAFGPRVPGSAAHSECGAWIASELRRHGAEVTEQRAPLTCFDGKTFEAHNLLGRYNPEATRRILLLAHWDTRPWADEDPDPAKRTQPVDGANDGASGVGVLLELARQLGAKAPAVGIDLLMVDLEDRGTSGDEESWALGTRHFIENPPIAGYAPDYAILLDMVGGEGATFCREYFSEQAAPQIAAAVWAEAHRAGYGQMFPNRMGGAVTDDHVQLINHGIPAIDIIEYHPDGDSGFNPRWHTTSDTMEGIDRATLGAVGQTVANHIYGL